MNLDESYSVVRHIEEVSKLIQQKVGEGVSPSNQKVSEFWEAVSNPMPPRTYMYILQVKENLSYRSKGLSLLGLPDSLEFTFRQILGLTHDNQRLLVNYQTLSLYEVFLNHPDLIKDKGVVYCTSRGVKNTAKKNSYWLVHQLAYPVQYDSNGIVTKYFCSYRIIGEYSGEALETQVFTSSQFPNEEEALRKILTGVKEKMLDVLGFTRTEQQIILYISRVETSTKEMAKQFNVSPSTIYNHRGSINKKAKEIFPLNNFQNTEDVIRYLKQQLII